MSWGVALRNAVGLGLGGIPSLLNAPPYASLKLNFTEVNALDPRITFSRNSNATLFGSNGSLQYAPHNLLTYSEQLDNAAWTKTNSTISANSVVAPDGTVTADSLLETTANAGHRLQGVATVSSGVPLAISVYVKANGRTRFDLFEAFSSTGFSFDLTNQTTSAPQTVGVASATSASISDAGNGWYRCTVVLTSTTTSASLSILISNGSTTAYAGDGTSGIYVWGAQLNVGALQPYYQTVASAYYGPRFDYDPATLAARGLLIEEQRTNSIRNNTMQGAVVGAPGTLPTNWSASLAGGLSREVFAVGQVNGINYIDLRVFGTTTNTNLALNLAFEPITGVSSASGQAWAESMYLSLVGGSLSGVANTRLYLSSTDGVSELAYFNLGDVTPTSALTRFSGTASPATAGMTAVRPMLWVQHNGIGTAIDFTLRIGLPQLELGAFATSVIPTTTTALTRAADVATMTGANFSDWYNQTEGTLLTTTLAFNQTFAPNRFISTIDDGTTSNIIGAYIATDLNATTFVVNGGVAQYQEVISTVSNTSANKISVTYKANNFTSACNGVIGPVDTSGNVPVVNKITFGNRTDGARPLNGWVRSFSYYPKQLSAGQLQALTK